MSDPLETLLLALRRRARRARALVAAQRALIVAGAMAVIAGLAHRWLIALPAPMALTIVIVPALTTALWTIARGRPTLEQCARTADRWFGSQDLLTSAWEISRSKNHSPAGAVVTARAHAWADAKAGSPGWPAAEARRFGSIAIPAALGIVGAFLLLNRGADPDGILTARSAAPAASPPAETAGTEPSIARNQTPRPTERRERPTVETEGIVVPDALDDGPQPLLLPDVTGSGAGAGGDLGKLATDDRPAPRLATDFQLPEMEVRIVAVAGVESAPELTTGSNGVELDDSGAAIGGSTNGGAVAGTGTLTEWNRLSVEQRRLADRYFELGRVAAETDEDPAR